MKPIVLLLGLFGLILPPLRSSNFTSAHLPSTASLSKIGNSNAANDETVRGELVGLQARDGLTIASYGQRGLRIVDFKKRKAFVGKPFPEHRVYHGTVSDDGNQVAFTLTSLPMGPPPTLGLMKTDNSDLREFPGARNSAETCWSHDMSQIALGIVNTPNTTLRLAVLNIATESVRELSPDLGGLTTQCWSPDGKEVVFEARGNVVVRNLEDGQQQTLGPGRAPTWSHDGNWIAFFDDRDHSYYVLQPSGERKKELFHHRNAIAGLYWSPDSRIVAYVVEVSGFLGALETYKLNVRRLEDGSEDWVDDGDLGCCESLQWVTNKALLSQIESEGSPK